LASDEQDRSGRVLADWQVIVSTRHLITASCGVQVAPTSDFVDPSKFDYIVVFGVLLTVENRDSDQGEGLHRCRPQPHEETEPQAKPRKDR
ncbi:hypothetical protein ACC754_39145, partial [Rhizobium johnstonii]